MKKADYTQIAPTYDEARPLPDINLEMCLKSIEKLIGAKKKVALLDLGCGTGRFDIPFTIQSGYSVTAIDGSKEMIEKARQKDTGSKVDWRVQDVANLQISDGSFDVIFMSHLLHHLDNPFALIQKCFHILKSDGILINRYGALENVKNDAEHKFFPEALKIDELRSPTTKQVESWFYNAGFKRVISDVINQPTFTSGEDRLYRIKLKHTSVLTLIPQRSFEEGLERLEKYVSENPFDPWLLNDFLTMTAGYKDK